MKKKLIIISSVLALITLLIVFNDDPSSTAIRPVFNTDISCRGYAAYNLYDDGTISKRAIPERKYDFIFTNDGENGFWITMENDQIFLKRPFTLVHSAKWNYENSVLSNIQYVFESENDRAGKLTANSSFHIITNDKVPFMKLVLIKGQNYSVSGNSISVMSEYYNCTVK